MPGDGVGPEVTAEAVKVLEASAVEFEFLDCSVGGEQYLKEGDPLPEEALEAVNYAEAVLFGAVGHEGTPYEIPRKVLIYLRMEKDTYANLRPLKLYPGVIPPRDRIPDRAIDLAIIRDNSEGFSLMHTGSLGNTIGSDRRVITDFGAKRIIKYAFEYAEKNHRKKVTCVDHSNWLFSDKLFRKNFILISERNPGVETEHLQVDVAAMMLARHPEDFDVIVTPDIYGDILSGVAISNIGGVGLAPSACIGDNFAFFEPIHGTAWDIAGQNVANPIASILSAKLMLEYLGYRDESLMIDLAVSEVLSDGKVRTPDIGGRSTTSEVGDAIAERIIELNNERKKYRDHLSQLRAEMNIDESLVNPATELM